MLLLSANVTLTKCLPFLPKGSPQPLYKVCFLHSNDHYLIYYLIICVTSIHCKLHGRWVGEGGSETLDVSFTAREGSENCQARSRCSIIIWIIGRSTQPGVQFPDPLPPAPHPQPCLPHVIGYQERKDAEHPQVCCTQNNLYTTMYLLPGRLRGRESPRLRPGGERGSSPFPGQPMGREPRWAGGQDPPHSRPTQGFLRVCSARGAGGRVGRENQRAGLPLASADSCLLSRCFHFFSLAFAHGFQSRDLTFAPTHTVTTGME